MFKRLINLTLPSKQSAFLWGARQTGKSSYLKTHFPHSFIFDFLKSDVFLSLSKQPSLLRERVLALDAETLSYPIILDEVQKVPLMLDEVHWLIENTSAQFILCGSSARKLKRSGANLLGGRAWKYHFPPLVSAEIPDFQLLQALNNGLLPPHYLSPNPQKSLQAYIEIYLIQEIKEEGLVRNLPSFARFLDSMAFHNGEMVNFSNIARDCGIDAKTVQNYFDILVDTLLGYYIRPYSRRVSREILRQTPKFYLFDVGVANYLSQRQISILKGSEAGKSFEHFILMELIAYKNIHDKRFEITYWRTKSGLEVDFILGNAHMAIEVKISECAQRAEIKGLIAFCEEHHPAKAIVVSQDTAPRKLVEKDGMEIDILPWQMFLQKLWQHDFDLP
jgi:predicted AAA+ superfamily ATPase